MSVPAHNIYDFVHQATNRKYWLLYFYPWGDRALENLVYYQKTPEQFNKHNGLDPNSVLVKQILPQHIIDRWPYELVMTFQPVLLCHDQEPLNFDLYSDHGEQAHAHRYPEFYDHETFPDLNLRKSVLYSWQRHWILLHSELNSHELVRYEQTGRFRGAYWWSHAFIARDWYRYAQYDQSLAPADARRTFLIYARDTTGTRQYRQTFLDQLGNLKSHCQIGEFGQQCVDATASAVYRSEDFNHTRISVVLETLFADRRIHLTEKILRPIACGHPFLLAAGPGSLKVLRDYGFQTFEPWINEHYDTIQDHDQRLQAILEEMRRIQQLSPQQQDQLWQQCALVVAHNKQRFFSSDFFDQITSEMINNINQAGEDLELDSEFYLAHRRYRRKHNPDRLNSEFVQLVRPYFMPLARKLRCAK